MPSGKPKRLHHSSPALPARDRPRLIRDSGLRMRRSRRVARSPRPVRERRRRHGLRPFPAAAAASYRFWPFGAIAVRTLKADNSVCASSDSRLLAARQDAPFPGNFLLRPHAPIFDTRPAAAFPPIRSISNLRARAVCASPYGIDGPPRPSRALVAPMVFRRSDGASSRERCPHAASFSSRRGLRH